MVHILFFLSYFDNIYRLFYHFYIKKSIVFKHLFLKKLIYKKYYVSCKPVFILSIWKVLNSWDVLIF